MSANNIQRVSILFRNLRQPLVQQKSSKAKSQFVYDVDKTFSQRWMQSRVAKIQQRMFYFKF